MERIPHSFLAFLLRLRDRIRRSPFASAAIYRLLRALKDRSLDEGWLRSFRVGRPVDVAGNPVPWIAYPAIRFLETRVGADLKVFEYGAGNSTLWWAKRVARVISCESDAAWAEEVRASLPGNAFALKAAL